LKSFDYSESAIPIREDLARASPGTWWTGAERVAIAREVRNATSCEYCKQRKKELSPYGFPGEHDHSGELEPRVVDAVHRIVTDQTRISSKWIADNVEHGFSEEHYVELLGVAVTAFSVDEFHRALSLPLEPLPEPLPGEPSQYRPSRAVGGTAFVAMLPHNGAKGKEADLWPSVVGPNVVRALSLVPEAVREWFLVAESQYLSVAGMSQMGDIPGRSINRMQMELVAGRVSAINECFY